MTAALADIEGMAAVVTTRSGASSDPVYRLPTGVRFDRRVWGDEVVMFNFASGQTHLLDALSARVLDAFVENAWSAPDLCVALADELAVDHQELRARLDAVIGEFVRLGLLDADPT